VSLHAILALSTECLLLFIRLCQRSAVWFRVSKLEYPEIATGISFDLIIPFRHFQIFFP
jgi:hypothetical protein